MHSANPSILVYGYAEASMVLRSAAGQAVSAVLAIFGKRETGIVWPHQPRLDLHFDDVAIPDDTNEVAMLQATARRRWCLENGIVEQPPTEDDVRKIIAFA